MKKLRALTLFCLFNISILNVLSQGVYSEFGENRVMFNTSQWEKVVVKNDEIIYEKGQQILIELISKQYSIEKRNFERDLQYQLRGKVTLVIFTRFSDYIQSNFGLGNQQFYAGGYVYTPHNDLFVYFDGSYKNLLRSIKEGIARAIINEMVLGGTMLERVQSSALVTLPEWFVGGLSSYLAEPWNTQRDNLMRDAIATKSFKRFSSLDKDMTVFAGHSFWFFIERTYGKKTIRNILFQTKYFRNPESALSIYTGERVGKLFKDWEAFFKQRYSQDELVFSKPKGEESRLRKHASHVHTGLNISPDGKFVSFVTHNRGSYKVWVYDIQKKSSNIIVSGGFKTYTREPNYFFPVVRWTDKNKLAVLDERKGKQEINIYNIKSQKIVQSISLESFDWVKEFVFSADGKTIALSATNFGKCNLYLKKENQKDFEQLTNDKYDVRDISFTQDGNILFISDRHTQQGKNDYTTFYGSYSVFYYHITKETIDRITPIDLNVSYARPIHLGGDYYSFISDKEGIFNSYVIEYKDSQVGFDAFYQLTNYNRNILFQDVSIESGKLAELVFFNGKHRVFISNYSVENPLNDTIVGGRVQTQYRKENTVVARVEPDIGIEKDSISDSTQYVDIDSILDVKEKIKNRPVFQTGFPNIDYIDTAKVNESRADSKNRESESSLEPQFKIDYFIIRLLDFNIIGDNYFQGGVTESIFNTPLFSPHLNLSLSDLFNNHVLEAGARMAGIPISGSVFGSDYYFKYRNRKGKFNKEVFFNRRARFIDFTTFYQRNIMTLGGASIQYPLSEKSRIELKTIIRNDAHIDLAIDNETLNSPGNIQYLPGLGFSYVFDNTVSRGLNRLQGTRMRAFAENYWKFGTEGRNTMAGIDIRHYQPLLGQIIWANRVSSSTSMGALKTAYYLGGPEQWYRPEFSEDFDRLDGSEYIFQAIGAPMRGFIRNARAGNSFAVVNSEFRIPILPLFTQKPIRSEILKSLMLVGFADFGTAWVGSTPYASGNTYNTLRYNLPSMKLTVTANRNPFIAGTGLGARIKIDSYYIKYDGAYGFMQDMPVKLHHYFSLGLDF